jgi:hypothetical protein
MKGTRKTKKAVASSPPGRALRQEVRRLAVEALARVRAMPATDLWLEVRSARTPLEIDSKEAEVVISLLEHKLGQELAKVEDLAPEVLLNLDVLVDLILRRYSGTFEVLRKAEGF